VEIANSADAVNRRRANREDELIDDPSVVVERALEAAREAERRESRVLQSIEKRRRRRVSEQKRWAAWLSGIVGRPKNHKLVEYWVSAHEKRCGRQLNVAIGISLWMVLFLHRP
jgi:hypothetical protein